MDLTTIGDAYPVVATVGVTTAGIWWILRLIHATQRTVVTNWQHDLEQAHRQHRADMSEAQARIGRLEVENGELREHVRLCERDTDQLRRRVAELEYRLNMRPHEPEED